MSCSSGACGKSFFPLPPGGGGGNFNPAAQPNNRRDRTSRRPTFFSRRMQHASAVIQDPASITFREFAYLVLAIFALYRGYFAATAAWGVLFRVDVNTMCYHRSFVGCGWDVLQYLGQIGWQWAFSVVPWALVGAVVVFFGEEAIEKLMGRRKA